MPMINQADWDKQLKVNTDPYGSCIMNVAVEVMRLLDTPEYQEFDADKIINDADDNIKAGGITGHMAGCVAQIVAHCHSRGEEFRIKWNKNYGVDENKAHGGVVNPALITIHRKED